MQNDWSEHDRNFQPTESLGTMTNHGPSPGSLGPSGFGIFDYDTNDAKRNNVLTVRRFLIRVSRIRRVAWASSTNEQCAMIAVVAQ